MVFFDLDDFCEDHPRLELLCELKQKIPNLLVTLFTIPGLCSKGWPQKMAKHYPWIDLAVHGWIHKDNYEALRWDQQEAAQRLVQAEGLGFTIRGFKAPGWQISDGCYSALMERGYWVADQVYNNTRRPPGLPAYLLTLPNQLHGHVGHLGGHNVNELEYLIPELLQNPNAEYGRITDLMNLMKGT